MTSAVGDAAALTDLIADRLELIHWNGHGCGTHGTSACSNCFGPSPMSAREVAEEAVRVLAGYVTTARAQGWYEACEAMAWTADNNNPPGVYDLGYVTANCPYRSTENTG